MNKTRIRIEPLMIDATSCSMTDCRAQIVNSNQARHHANGKGLLSLIKVNPRKFKEMTSNGFAYVMDYAHNVH